ncbi:hypothetical protein OJJOAM_001642 [Cupriavidus sp. H18C1]
MARGTGTVVRRQRGEAAREGAEYLDLARQRQCSCPGSVRAAELVPRRQRLQFIDGAHAVRLAHRPMEIPVRRQSGLDRPLQGLVGQAQGGAIAQVQIGEHAFEHRCRIAQRQQVRRAFPHRRLLWRRGLGARRTAWHEGGERGIPVFRHALAEHRGAVALVQIPGAAPFGIEQRSQPVQHLLQHAFAGSVRDDAPCPHLAVAEHADGDGVAVEPELTEIDGLVGAGRGVRRVRRKQPGRRFENVSRHGQVDREEGIRVSSLPRKRPGDRRDLLSPMPADRRTDGPTDRRTDGPAPRRRRHGHGRRSAGRTSLATRQGNSAFSKEHRRLACTKERHTFRFGQRAAPRLNPPWPRTRATARPRRPGRPRRRALRRRRRRPAR